MYYIISLKHTHSTDNYIVLWRANNKGYTYRQDLAGLYEDYERGYHDHEGDSMPIKKEDLDGLFMATADGIVVPNNKRVRRVLGFKQGKRGLLRLSKPMTINFKNRLD